MSAFKYQWNQTIDVGTAGLLSKQWTSIRHILSLLVTANAWVHVTAHVAVRRSLSTTYTAVVLGLLLRQYVSYQFGVWAAIPYNTNTILCGIGLEYGLQFFRPETTGNSAGSNVIRRSTAAEINRLIDPLIFHGRHGDVWIIPSFRIWSYNVLHVEHISCVTVNCGQHQRAVPSLFPIAL